MRKRAAYVLAGLGLLVWSGCRAPEVVAPGLVFAPAMTFSESGVWRFDSSLAPQVETGTAFAGGGQAAGCSSCR